MVVLGLLPVAGAADLTVGKGGDYATILDAVRAAADGDTILVGPGHYIENVEVTTSLTLRSTDGPEATIFSGFPVKGSELDANLKLRLGPTVTVDGFTFDGQDMVRHCLRVLEGGTVHVTNSVFTDCRAGDGLGGGLRLEAGATGTVDGSRFSNNRGVFENGITGRGGHIWTRGAELTVRDTLFEDGVADGGDGGAIVAVDGILTVERSVFQRHTATDDGGTIVADGLPSLTGPGPKGGYTNGVDRFTLIDSVIVSGTAETGVGGALFVREVPEVEIVRNLFCGNAAAGRGGALWSQLSEGLVANNVFVGNTSAGEGGALFDDRGVLAIENDDFWGNAAGGNGAAIALLMSTGTVRNVLFAGHGGASVVWDWGADVGPFDHDAWWDNAAPEFGGGDAVPGPNDVYADPLIAGVALDGVCGDDDFRRGDGSPLRDAGDPVLTDPDGSRSDIGAYGGPNATPCPDDSLDGTAICPPEDTGTTTPPGTTPTTPPTTSTSGTTPTPTDAPAAEGRPTGGCGCGTWAPPGPVVGLALVGGMLRRRRGRWPTTRQE